MRVLVFGQRRWGAYLALQLNRHGSAWSVVADYLNVAAPEFRLPRVAAVKRADVIIRVGFPVGAPSIRGRTFDFLWRALRVINPSALYLHYWIGTDIQSVTQYRVAGRLRLRIFEEALGAMHATTAPWLVDELRELSVNAANLPFNGLDLPSLEERELSLPSQFTVLTYIPDRRWAFYGGEQMAKAARRLPRVRFLVTAGTGDWLRDRPANVTFLGWRDDMVELYKNSTVVLRLAEHDAVGCTALEGLAMARHVIRNYPVPFTTQVAFADVDRLVAEIGRLWDSHNSGMLLPNISGRRWAVSTYDQGRLIRALCEALTERLRERPGRESHHSAIGSRLPTGTGDDEAVS
jgi:hypothetical protein